MIVFPNAKINVGLNILRRRADGYHDLDTLFVPYYGLKDILEIAPSETFGMYLYGNPVDGDPMENLCARAYRLLSQDFALPPVAIHLYKNIPTGAGLGGGSSDASFTLAVLDSMFSLNLGKQTLASYAARLGSDCPFFIYNSPMMAHGRGEILEPYELKLDGYRIEVVTPDVFVSTREAYAGCIPHIPEKSLEELLRLGVDQWTGLVVNDFEKTVFKCHPSLLAEKEKLYSRGAVYASMSGSGSSLFGIFKDS